MFLITFSGVENHPLASLARHGGVYAVPQADGPEAALFCLTALQTVLTRLEDQDSREVVFRIPHLPVVSQQFLIDSSDSKLFFLGGSRLIQDLNILMTNGIKNYTRFEIRQVWSGTNLYQLVVGADLHGTWNLSVSSPEHRTSSELLYLVISSPRPLDSLAPWVDNHLEQEEVEDRPVSLYWLLDDDQHEEKVTATVTGPNTSVAITMKDDGLLSPDLVAGDGLYSATLHTLRQPGWHSPLLSASLPSALPSSLQPSLTTAGQGFYLLQPLTTPPPPDRVTDLVIQEEPEPNSSVVRLAFTEPWYWGSEAGQGEGRHM